MTATALIIDDEADIRELVSLALSRMGLESMAAANLEDARNLLRHHPFDICLCDMRLPDGDGVEFVRYLQSRYPELPVAVITAHGSMQAAVEAMKNGAFDFVSKPVNIQLLRKLVAQALSARRGDLQHNDLGIEVSEASDQPVLSSEIDIPEAHTRPAQHPAQPAAVGRDLPELIGDSQPMQDLRHLITRVARTNAPVWIHGESGTGKELIARNIHLRGPRHDGPFIAVNCGAIPSELMESEFFGHLKGSFTGAHADREGLFQRASGGTLFLDEVAELPLHMQVKLLRAIQERAVRPVGDTREHAVDTRILSASHKDLATEVQAGNFRQDLYYRLNVITLQAPPLRKRLEDIPVLADHILERIQQRNADDVPVELGPQALRALLAHRFDGNVRELENILERAVALRQQATLSVDDLDLPNEPVHDAESLTKHSNEPGRELSSSAELDRDTLLEVLNQTRWNRKEAARQLGLSYRQLRYRIQQLGIDKAC